MRQIALDTETTGLEVTDGERIVEIGCVEIIDRSIGERTFHQKINPEREISEKATEIHGYTWKMLKGSPRFADICDEFMTFVQGSEVLIHNAAFDIGFLDAELARLNRNTFVEETGCTIVDTLELARKLRVASTYSLDALSDRYQIDRSRRTLHGALIDADLLAQVYLAMTSGQTSMSFFDEAAANTPEITDSGEVEALSDEGLVVIEASADELSRHERFMEMLNKEARQ